MPKYVIEREIPGAGALSPEALLAISQKSCGVLKNLGPEVQWVHSYVTADKIYCVYIAPNEALVREHASRCRSQDHDRSHHSRSPLASCGPAWPPCERYLRLGTGGLTRIE
jgi:hypothetical protein